MASYHLQIVTPDGLCFDGQAEKLLVRTTTGDVCILARHINFVTALGMGAAKVVVEGEIRRAACIGGMLSVHDGAVKLVASSFEWAQEIDRDRAVRAEAAASAKLESRASLSEREITVLEAERKRALVRLGVAET